MTNAETCTANYERQRRMRKELGKKNRTVIFAALARANIELVLVSFDGEGDSGQIGDITASRNEQTVPLPDVKVKLRRAEWGKTDPEISKADLTEAITALCYDLLEDDHAGWENNDGAFGEFRLNVKAKTIDLELNARFIETLTTIHPY
jgi:hypothetical protein